MAARISARCPATNLSRAGCCGSVLCSAGGCPAVSGLSYFVLCKLSDDGFPQAEITSAKVRAAFAEFPDWRRSETAMRELRKKITFALFADEDDIDKVTATVEQLLTLVQKSFKQ